VQERNVIIGTDWWTDCDDVAAIRIACVMAKKGVWSLRGVVLNACMEYSAPSLDGFLRHEGLILSIGIDPEANDFGGRPPYQERMARNCSPALRNEDCESGVRLYRRLLSESPDGTAEFIEIGYMQVLYALLTSPPDDLSPLSGGELAGKKLRRVWMMAGNWKNDGKGRENNFCRNRRTSRAASKLPELLPCPLTLLGYEIGESVMTRPFPDFNDPLWLAFKDHGSEKGRCSWDPMLMLLAAEGPEKAGYSSVRGRVSVDPESGENSFCRDPDGRHEYVIKTMPDCLYEQRIAEALEWSEKNQKTPGK